MKRTTFIIGILLGLALIAGACRGCQLDETAAASRTAVLDTGVKGEDGGEHYVGGLIEVDGGHRIVKYIPGGEDWTF